MTPQEQEISIYHAYPRRVARIAALKAITKAVTYLVRLEGISPLEARRKLYKAVALYANSASVQHADKNMIPHPASWFNAGRYLDDPKEWQHGGINGTNHGSPANKWDRLRAEIDREAVGEETHHHDG